jgi:hypothetical protein
MPAYRTSSNRLRELAAEADRMAKTAEGGALRLAYLRLAKGCRTLLARLRIERVHRAP